MRIVPLLTSIFLLVKSGLTSSGDSEIIHQAITSGAGVEEFVFETQVNKVMDILINSLYKTKDVFLRELISNSADALDKIRFQALTDSAQIDSNTDLQIYIKADKDARTISIRDGGIGMTKEFLRTNLGTVAKSGTSEFLKAIEQKNLTDPGLIGRFGVGFYSAFLVADRVQVVSKNNADDQYIWESTSQENFKIVKDPRGNTLGRGTEIILHIKQDSVNFLDEIKLEQVVKKHSEFINFPINIWKSSRVPEEVDEETKDAASDVEDVSEAEKPKEAPKMKTVWDWSLLNDVKPIWTSAPSDILPEEYNGFYKSHFKEYENPLAYSHFKLEGEHRFNALIFIPSKAPPRFLQPDAPDQKSFQLFVRRVFITDELHDILPKWLSFIKVMIDSDDLPLNVNRENLQSHASLKIIRNRIVSKALDLMVTLSVDSPEVFEKIHDIFGTALRYGLIDSKTKHADKIQKLLRFETSFSSYVSLDEYVKNMKKQQPQIYLATGSTFEEIKTSPLAEKVIKRGYEVLLIADHLEEYVVQEKIKTFNDIPLQNVAKDGLLFGDEDDEKAEQEKEVKEKFDILRQWISDELHGIVDSVRVSTRLSSAACAIVPGPLGISPSQERSMAYQMGGKIDPQMKFYFDAKRIMEINPYHPIMQKLLEAVENKETAKFEQIPEFLFEIYSVSSGYDVRQPSVFGDRVEKLLRVFVGVDLEAFAEERIEPAPEPESVSVEDAKLRIKEAQVKRKLKEAEVEAELRADAQRKVQASADEADRAAGVEKKQQPKFDEQEIRRKIEEHERREQEEQQNSKAEQDEL